MKIRRPGPKLFLICALSLNAGCATTCLYESELAQHDNGAAKTALVVATAPAVAFDVVTAPLWLSMLIFFFPKC